MCLVDSGFKSTYTCSRYILHPATPQDVVTRLLAVTSQSCRSNLIVSIAQERCKVSLYSMQGTTPQQGHVTCDHGFQLTPQVCMETRRVGDDYGLQRMVLRRTTSVDVGDETRDCCARQPQEGFVVAKLLVSTPTSAGSLIRE